jgi:hypothetical protein
MLMYWINNKPFYNILRINLDVKDGALGKEEERG